MLAKTLKFAIFSKLALVWVLTSSVIALALRKPKSIWKRLVGIWNGTEEYEECDYSTQDIEVGERLEEYQGVGEEEEADDDVEEEAIEGEELVLK